jgi:putative Mg2+ transporter-C (MgtC) family protein
MQFVVLGEVAAAMALGGAIGYERESANRPAGFRTHMLVAGAAALLVALGDALVTTFGLQHGGLISADPFRLVGGVIAALGFIGAGTIFSRDGRNVEGLTTAASLLFSGGIGVAVGIRQWWLAIGATVLALLVLRGLQQFEALIHRRGRARDQRGETA